MAPGLVPDIHYDGLDVLGVPDDLVQEAHPQGPRPYDQIVCGQLCYRDKMLSPLCSAFNIK